MIRANCLDHLNKRKRLVSPLKTNAFRKIMRFYIMLYFFSLACGMAIFPNKLIILKSVQWLFSKGATQEIGFWNGDVIRLGWGILQSMSLLGRCIELQQHTCAYISALWLHLFLCGHVKTKKHKNPKLRLEEWWSIWHHCAIAWAIKECFNGLHEDFFLF